MECLSTPLPVRNFIGAHWCTSYDSAESTSDSVLDCTSDEDSLCDGGAAYASHLALNNLLPDCSMKLPQSPHGSSASTSDAHAGDDDARSEWLDMQLTSPTLWSPLENTCMALVKEGYNVVQNTFIHITPMLDSPNQDGARQRSQSLPKAWKTTQ